MSWHRAALPLDPQRSRRDFGLTARLDRIKRAAPVAFGGAGARHRRLGLGLAALVLVADQVSKWLIMDAVLGTPRAIEIAPFLNLVWVWNQGVSFGMLGGGAVSPWLLSGLALAVSVALAIWLGQAETRLLGTALGLVIGGAVGNVVDRVRFGAVFDFIDVHAAGYHWPAFNVADSAITVGVALLLVDSLRPRPAQ
ncbi:MAG: signal peptidase II [Alphaproteobacteria bacterium]|nr:signal peptidase II [Alphaproteobacteria bacterium]